MRSEELRFDKRYKTWGNWSFMIKHALNCKNRANKEGEK
jgi:hypothetical protein